MSDYDRGTIPEDAGPMTEVGEAADPGSALPVRWGDSQQYHAEPHMSGGIVGEDGRDYGVEPRVTLLSMTPNPLGVIAAMASMYEGKVVRSLDDLTEAELRSKWDDVLATHLNTPLEAVQLHFLLEGVDRAFTHQLVRQRVGAAYAQESLRFAVVDDLLGSTTLPPSLAGTIPLATPGAFTAHPDERQAMRNLWDNAIGILGTTYETLVNSGMPAEEARGLLPHCTATRVHYVTNLRALSDHAGNRLCTQAQFHWRIVFAGMIDAIRNYNPGLPDYTMEGQSWSDVAWQYETIADSKLFRPVCFQLGRCPFKASFDRHCSIRDQVDIRAEHGVGSEDWEEPFHYITKRNRATFTPGIRPAQWLADPTAARRKG